MKILILSAEVAPFAKAGGLADVCGSLPKALALLGHDVRVVMPAYGSIERAMHQGKWDIRPLSLTLEVPMGTGAEPAGVFEGKLPGTDVPIYFIAERNRFDRPFLYGYGDDAGRFSFFSRAALDLMIAALGWRPDVVHAHDWHAAPAILWLATAGQADGRYANIPTAYTIHNLRHQGTAPWSVLDYLGVRTQNLKEERFGEVNFMARGIFHATMINTVSPTYAREIMGWEGGNGLDALLRQRHFDVHGILNGLDDDEFDPATDRRLAATFSAEKLDQRFQNKRALQARFNLPQRDDVPLVGMVSRLDVQKGLDIAGHVFHLLMNGQAGEAQCIVLGGGEPEYENMLRHLAGYHRDKMIAYIGYEPDLAQLIYGGSDIFLMPSLFEPCGLGQMIAMRYGSVPIVRATGGLADTVRPGVTGFAFHYYSSDDCWHTLRNAIDIYRHDPDTWREIQCNGMKSDFSWRSSARAYQQLYEWAISRTRGW
ncbi:MAG: glycogen synthase [Gemmataceae bacterium]|nr:glycogen synthase [Gemmataceae bacterium]